MAIDADADVDIDPAAARELRAAAEDFLYHEAQLLDDRRLVDWHRSLVAEDVDYRVPVRTTRERSAESEFSDSAFHMKDDWGSLKVRTERMENDFAWSEDPPSRNRRLVSNVRVVDHDPDAEREELTVRDNLLVYRSRGEERDHDLLAGERYDTLRRADNGPGWRLARRRVRLDHTVLPTASLSIIL